MGRTWVLSLGGSLIAPDQVDTQFLGELGALLRELSVEQRFVVVCGGGAVARRYQGAYRQLTGSGNDDAADWVGIAATRLNAELVKQMLGDVAGDDVVYDPSVPPSFTGRVLVAAGWKPGFSHDYDAVLLAEQLRADTLIKLSNLAQVYSADPKIYASATPYESLDWAGMTDLMGDGWAPGSNLPFDPVATAHSARLRLKLIVAGADLTNLRRILAGESYHGTTVGPD